MLFEQPEKPVPAAGCTVLTAFRLRSPPETQFRMMVAFFRSFSIHLSVASRFRSIMRRRSISASTSSFGRSLPASRASIQKM
jgi:hypothetical protein